VVRSASIDNEKLSQAYDQATKEVKQAYDQATEEVKQVTKQVTQQVQKVTQQAEQTLTDVENQVDQEVKQVVTQVQKTAVQVQNSVRQTATQVSNAVSHAYDSAVKNVQISGTIGSAVIEGGPVTRYGALREWVMLLLGSLALLAVDNCIATTVNKDLCEDEWTHVQQVPAVGEQLRQWSALGNKCAHSGLYESRLARLNILAGQFEEARRVTRAGLALKSSYEKELLSAAAEIDLNQMKLDSALLQYEAIIKSYPDYYDGYGGVGTVKLMQHNFTEAVQYLNQAAARGKVPVYIYRNLIIAHHQLGENQQAIDAVNTAYKVDKDIVKDKDAMNATARSYIFIGKYKAADGALKMLVKSNPEAANDPQIRETMGYVAKKLEEEKQSGADKG
jgi:hypothetical protein